MKLERLTFKSQLVLSLFLVLALGVSGLALADQQDGGGITCTMTPYLSYCKVYSSSPSCGGGQRWVLFNEECCYNPWYYTRQCSWKQVATGCGTGPCF